jgi:hypothetical protein
MSFTVLLLATKADEIQEMFHYGTSTPASGLL